MDVALLFEPFINLVTLSWCRDGRLVDGCEAVIRAASVGTIEGACLALIAVAVFNP